MRGDLLPRMLFFKRSDHQRNRFENLAKQHFNAIYSTALRYTRDPAEAEDLAQEATLRAYQNFARFDGQNFKAWILRILTNLYINEYHSKKRSHIVHNLEQNNGIEPKAPSAQMPDNMLFDELLGSEIEQALTKLPAEFRITVILSDIQELSYQEVADATQVPIGTVRSRLARGRSLLRNQLETYAEQQGYIK